MKKIRLTFTSLILGAGLFFTASPAQAVDYGNGVHCDDEGCDIHYDETVQQITETAIANYATGLAPAPAKIEVPGQSKSKKSAAVNSSKNSSSNSNRPEPGTTTGNPN